MTLGLSAQTSCKTSGGVALKGSLGWRILIEQGLSAQAQMARDAALAGQTIPTARFFLWQPPAVSLGFKQAAPSWLKSGACTCAGLETVERPTAGGLAFHGSDVSVSVVVPRTINISLCLLMEAVCRNAVALCEHFGVKAKAVLEAAAEKRITYCLTEVSPYAVMIKGKKVAGFALRRFPQTWLIQGSILVRPLPQLLARALPESMAAQLSARAIALAEAAGRWVDEETVAGQWARQWADSWESVLLQALAGDGG